MAQGRGTIRPHGDGAWRIQVYAGTDPVTGKERRCSKVVRGPRREAERALTKLLVEVDEGRGPGTTGRTLGDAVDAFLTHATVTVEPSTLGFYRHQASYIPDRLRAMPLARLDVEHLEGLYAHLATAGKKRTGGPLGAKSVRNVATFCHGVLELARRRRWISVNPAADAVSPPVPRREPTPTPVEGVGRLFGAAAAEHRDLEVYLRVSVCLGCRRSEVHGLRWCDLDLERGTARIVQVVVNAGGRWVVKPRTKTGRARTVGLTPATVEALRALQAAMMNRALECDVVVPADGFVFSDDPVGAAPWNPNTTAQRFKRAARAAGLPEGTRLHDLRHLMATYLLDQGVPLPAVSGRLGHERNSTTLDVYTGRLDPSDVVATEAMARLLDRL